MNASRRFYDESPKLINSWKQRKKILDKWVEHIKQVSNRPLSIAQAAIDLLAQVPINEALDNSPGKDPGWDAISAEM